MIYLNDKIANTNNLGMQRVNAQPRAFANKIILNSDTVSFSATPSNETKPQDKNKTMAYILGGLALAAVAAFAVIKIKRGRGSSVNTGKDIKKGIDELGKEVNQGVKNTEKTALANAPQEDEMTKELVESQKRVRDLENEANQVKQEQELAAKQQIDEIINDVIKTIKPKDEAIAKEAIPQLITHAKTLGISFDDFNKFLQHITPENKDFVIKEGIPLIAENMEKIKVVAKDSEKAHELLKHVAAENQDIFTHVVDNAETFKVKSIGDVVDYLKRVKPENREFVFNEVMPLIIEHNEKLKLESAYQISAVLGHITKDTKDVIETIAKNSDKLDLDGLSTSYLISGVTPENKNCISVLADNAKKFELDSFFDDDFKKLLDKGKDGILEEANKV